MERRQIEHFLAVVDRGGFTPAAAALYVSQPSLSHSIKMLERDLGAPLFHRLPRGVRLTAAGEVFVDAARRILQELEAARSRVQAVSDLVVGTLDIVTLPGLLLDPLSGLIGRFRDQYPGVTVRVHHAEGAAEVHGAVCAGSAEIGLSDEVGTVESQLISDLVSEQELQVVLPPGTEAPASGVVQADELLDMRMVTGPPGTEVRDLLSREARRRGREFVPVVEVGLRGAALYLVLAGAGAAVLPRPLAESGRANGAVLVPLRPTWCRRAYLLRRNATLSPPAGAFCRMVLDCVAPHLGEGLAPAAS